MRQLQWNDPSQTSHTTVFYALQMCWKDNRTVLLATDAALRVRVIRAGDGAVGEKERREALVEVLLLFSHPRRSRTSVTFSTYFQIGANKYWRAR